MLRVFRRIAFAQADTAEILKGFGAQLLAAAVEGGRQAAEDAILARFRGLDVTIVSEEIGRYGSGKTLVVVDPIDGSLNAKRGIPFFSLSIAFADGEISNDPVEGRFVCGLS